MQMTKQEVERLAKLARLAIDKEQDLAEYAEDLQGILGYVDKLDELDVSEVEPTTHAVMLQMQPREDIVDQRLSQAQVLLNAPAQEDSQFQVPRVVSQQEG